MTQGGQTDDGMSERDVAAALAIRELLTRTGQHLRSAAAPEEPFAEFLPERRRFGVFRQSSRMSPRGTVWRLGVFLLDTDPDSVSPLHRAGHSTRAVPPGHPGHHSRSAEERREYRGAALRGGYPEGTTVHFDAEPIELDAKALRESTGPLILRDGVARVRWSRTAPDADAPLFSDYLAERVDLLLNPPEGA